MDELGSLLEAAKTWATKGVIVDGIILSESGEEEKVPTDVCLHIGCDSNDATRKKQHTSNFLSLQKQGKLEKIYLSSEFNEQHPDGRKSVIAYITNMFDAHGGGNIISGGCVKGKIEFKCKRYRVHMPKEKSKSSRDTVTSRPKDKEDVCPWKFNLYYEPPESAMAGRYYFYRNGSGNHFHYGHLPKKEHEIMKRTSQLDEEELEIADDGMGVNLSSDSMAMMFQKRTGLAIDPKKLRNYHTKKKQQGKDSGVSQYTPAEQVILQLESDKTVSVAYLIAKVEVGQALVTTYTKKKSKTNRNLSITFQSNVTSNGIQEEPKTLTSSDIMSTSYGVSRVLW